MSNEAKLRKLLAEALEVVQGVLRAADSTPYAQWSRDQHQAEIVRDAIEAALAEPSENWKQAAEIQEMFKQSAMRERDEARSELERLKVLYIDARVAGFKDGLAVAAQRELEGKP